MSEQYTRENLFQIYKESIILELNQISPIIATMFKKAPVRFEDNGKMVIDLESSIVSEARMKTLKDTIERIFANRFDMPIEVRIEKRLIDENRFAKRNARRLQNEVNVLLSKNQDIEEAEEKEKKEKPKRVRKATYSTDPDMVYGREFKFDADTKLSDVFEGTGETVVRGQIMTMEDRETRTGKFIVTMEITDFTDSIAVKLFLGDENAKKEFYGKVKKNSFVRVKGVAKYDTYDRQVEISSVEGMRLIPAFTVGEKRKDTAVDKRVELHCHTNMSDMDGVSKCGKIVRRAYEWGHKAIAITDHGVVQAFLMHGMNTAILRKNVKEKEKNATLRLFTA
ncbi:MAG: PHP domain-containing protein [Eubacterium sp.]